MKSFGLPQHSSACVTATRKDHAVSRWAGLNKRWWRTRLLGVKRGLQTYLVTQRVSAPFLWAGTDSRAGWIPWQLLHCNHFTKTPSVLLPAKVGTGSGGGQGEEGKALAGTHKLLFVCSWSASSSTEVGQGLTGMWQVTWNHISCAALLFIHTHPYYLHTNSLFCCSILSTHFPWWRSA